MAEAYFFPACDFIILIYEYAIKINDKLNKKFHQQKDGICEQDEELRLR